ncbi:MAG: L-seryl-tRNA(Sec) selenium transferase [Planctomycetota bacterium]|jgi:L-seryl-tRNA(Ser) seleniumtransferase
MADKQSLLRQLPSVDSVLRRIREDGILEIGPDFMTRIAREAVEQVRGEILSDSAEHQDVAGLIVQRVQREIETLTKPFYRKVVNAAGIVLHTGLGRAVLPAEAMRQIQEEMAGYSLLQVSVEDGKRSKRDGHIERLLTLLTGAEAATVVNNNAAATALVLNTIAAGKEVIVSRGQLVEIGGAFRLPDVMSFSGAKLVEVGTTNKTHLRDYENAITEETAAILRVHPSNYKIRGFTSEVPLKELSGLAHANGLTMFDDVGAGSLIDFTPYGFEKEPTLLEAVADGADVITSSGDKLIGASQAGIILGNADILQKVRKNQFARIVRADKLSMAALEATLRLFLDGEAAFEQVPTVKMLLRPVAAIRKQASSLAAKLRKVSSNCDIQTTDGYSQAGSGSFPDQNLPTRFVCIEVAGIPCTTLANRLRHHRTPIFVRLQEEKVCIDPRTLLDGDDKIILEALTEIAGS